MKDFLTEYLAYTEETESHKIYHRWSAITAIGAIIGRNRHIPFGHFKLYSNYYAMLLGEPGARKSSAIKLIKKLISAAGYETFAADRSSREKFLLDLGGESEDEEAGALAKKVRNGIDITDANLWGSSSPSSMNGSKVPAEVFIVADEFNEFVSAGNVDFYTTLGNLWDWDDDGKNYEDKVKNSRSVSIYQPTVSLLGGNTQENFARAFPPEILGHGFLSRLLLIHGVPSGRKIAFPKSPEDSTTTAIVSRIRSIQTAAASSNNGKLMIEAEAMILLEKIYVETKEIQDPRFKGYNTRRYTHLLKLCIITSAVMSIPIVTAEVVVYANTMLSAIEARMPDALGEFGKSKNSDVAHKILAALTATIMPMPAKLLWRIVHKDLDKMATLSELLHNLQAAEKIQHVQMPGGKSGWLPKKEVASEIKYVDWSLLSQEERDML